jgi:hypothetical protein
MIFYHFKMGTIKKKHVFYFIFQLSPSLLFQDHNTDYLKKNTPFNIY